MDALYDLLQFICLLIKLWCVDIFIIFYETDPVWGTLGWLFVTFLLFFIPYAIHRSYKDGWGGWGFCGFAAPPGGGGS